MSFRYHFTKQIIHPVFLDVAYARHKIMEQRRIFPQEGKKGLLLSLSLDSFETLSFYCRAWPNAMPTGGGGEKVNFFHAFTTTMGEKFMSDF